MCERKIYRYSAHALLLTAETEPTTKGISHYTQNGRRRKKLTPFIFHFALTNAYNQRSADSYKHAKQIHTTAHHACSMKVTVVLLPCGLLFTVGIDCLRRIARSLVFDVHVNKKFGRQFSNALKSS